MKLQATNKFQNIFSQVSLYIYTFIDRTKNKNIKVWCFQKEKGGLRDILLR